MFTPARLAALFFIAAAAAPAFAQPVARDGALVDRSGRTLYVLDGDNTRFPGSACTGTCLKLWKPLYANEGASTKGDYSFVVRGDDGRVQWAYKGRPLYLYWNDQQPGDHGGDELRGQAHVARP